MAKDNFRQKVQDQVSRMAKAGKTATQIQKELKQEYGKAYRRQEILKDMRQAIAKPEPARKDTYKYTPKKYRQFEVKPAEAKFQKRKYSAKFEITVKKPNGRLEKVYRQLTFSYLPPGNKESILTAWFRDMLQAEMDDDVEGNYLGIKGTIKKIRLVGPVTERVIE